MARSNYGVVSPSGITYRDEDPDTEYARCFPCRGTGLDYVDGYETDCLECEGFGSVPI